MKKTRTNYSQSFKQQVLDAYFQSGMSQTVERLSVEYPHVTMEVLCGLFGKTKQVYYKHKRK